MATTATTPRPVNGRIGDHGTWTVVSCRPRHFCRVCDQAARWKGLVGAERFNAGRVCDAHWPDLVRVCKDLADGWQPPPRRY